MIRLFFDLSFIFVGNFRNRGPRKRIDESNAPWTHLPLAWNLRQGRPWQGPLAYARKKIRFNLLKISSKFVGHEMMRCPIYSPTNLAYMSRWMAKIQFKPNKEESKIVKESQAKVGTSKHGIVQRLHFFQVWPTPMSCLG